MNTKICGTCKIEKHLLDFHRKNDGHHTQCKKCRSEYTSRYRAKYPEESRQAVSNWVKEDPARNVSSHKRSNLKKFYGLSLEGYEKMLIQQNGCCLICSIKMNSPHVDHCHETGRIRGLLCATCNGGLGMFKDCVPLLEKAIGYLKR